MNIKDYINFQRIEKSKLLLENTSETVIEIVNKIGFNNVTYFNKVFRCYVDMSPTQYRRLKKQK